MTSYGAALARSAKLSRAQCDDEAAMAAFCESTLPLMFGAVSPRLIWEGAQQQGLSHVELVRLCASDPRRVEELQWLP